MATLVSLAVSMLSGRAVRGILRMCLLTPGVRHPRGLFYGIDILSLAAGGLVFILLLFSMIHQKIRYINRLEQELKILGSGNLEYPMTIRGNDELTSLAEGISALKEGVLDQQQMKDEAEKANIELVTAMSHDLRTPLTSLIGYLELLTMNRYENEEQLQKYLGHCREKAFQLKRMSDSMFEYFLVYGKQEQGYHFHAADCEELVESLCNGYFLSWQDRGGSMDCRIGELKGKVWIDGEYMRRVTDNIDSNLQKYGDIQYPLEIEAGEKEGMLCVVLRNHVLPDGDHSGSTQVGLRNCRRIVEKHGGALTWKLDQDCFEMELKFPLGGGSSPMPMK